MNQRVLHKLVDVILYHWDNYLFPGRTFSCYLNMKLRLRRSSNDVVDLVNFFCTHERKCFFDLEYVSHASILFGGLSVRLGFVRCQVVYFITLEKLRDFINLFWRFGQDKRGKPFDTSQGWSFIFLISSLRS